MPTVASDTLPLGSPAPDFRLPDTQGNMVARDDFTDKPALLVIFMCNHCPYVKHLSSALASFAREFEPRGLAVVGINSNDAEKYPDDSYEAMKEEKLRAGYPFPYLHDEDQSVARAYQAVCTPDFFLFDSDRKLVYRGRFDSSTPRNDEPVTGDDMRDAVTAVLTGQPLAEEQPPAMGCSIKWKT
jgi:peroxiredoxin